MAKILYFVTSRDALAVKLAAEHADHEIGICLLQDAVYLGCKGTRGRAADEAIKLGIPIFAAKKDVELRGVTHFLQQGISVLDYGEIIDLVLQYERVINM